MTRFNNKILSNTPNNRNPLVYFLIQVVRIQIFMYFAAALVIRLYLLITELSGFNKSCSNNEDVSCLFFFVIVILTSSTLANSIGLIFIHKECNRLPIKKNKNIFWLGLLLFLVFTPVLSFIIPFGFIFALPLGYGLSYQINK